MVVNKGNSLIMGCTKVNRSYNFSFASSEPEIELIIYDSDCKNIIFEHKMDWQYKTGDVFSCKITGVGLDRCYYVYKKGNEYITDPYAKTVTGCEIYGEVHEKIHLSRVGMENFDWEDDRLLSISYADSIIYKLNVRGFTKSCTSAIAHKGTFKGIAEKLPYLKSLE